MNTNSIEKLNGSVNVTIHKNYFKKDDTNHARVQRTTAGMDNVIALVCEKSNLFDKVALVAAQMLFKDAILDLLQQGAAVNLFELGTLYPCSQGSINSNNPSPTEIPPLTLGFTPAQVSLEAVSKATVSMSQLAETHPVINLIEDLSTHKSDFSLSLSKPVRITGRRLKIAGDASETGLYFAPHNDQGLIDETEADWIRVEDAAFFKNTSTFLEFILPASLSPDTSYSLVIKTASGRGKTVNKTVRKLVFDKTITIN